MTQSHPDDFYINGAGYPRSVGYGELCAELVGEADSRPDTFWSLNKLLDFAGKHINAYYDTNEHGVVRPIGQAEYTRAHQWQQNIICRTLERIFGSSLAKINSIDISCSLPLSLPDSEDIVLTRIQRAEHQGKGAWELQHFNTADEETVHTADRLWSICSQYYHAARNGRSPLIGNNLPLSRDERKAAAIECYWYLSHYMPFQRGSAGAARIVLEHLAHTVGFTTGKLKPDMDINIEALLRSRQDFVAHFDGCFESPSIFVDTARTGPGAA